MKASRLLSALGLFAAVAAGSGAAHAQAKRDFSKAGTLTIGAERLTGLYVTDGSTELDGTVGMGPIQAAFRWESDDSATSFVFLGSGLESVPAGAPRLGADYFIIDRLSIGGAFTYASTSNTVEARIQGTPGTETEQSVKLLSITPRAGFGTMFTDLLGLWARGGFTYTSYSIETDEVNLGPPGGTESSELEADLFTIALDASLVVSPVDHVAFTVGPQLDIPLTGSVETTNIQAQTRLDGDLSILTFGVSAGLLVWF